MERQRKGIEKPRKGKKRKEKVEIINITTSSPTCSKTSGANQGRVVTACNGKS